MSKECWETCPRVRSIVRLASEVTEYMPPGQTVDNIWTRHGNEVEALAQDCPGPTLETTANLESRLPFYAIRKFLGFQTTETFELNVYDCTVRTIHED